MISAAKLLCVSFLTGSESKKKQSLIVINHIKSPIGSRVFKKSLDRSTMLPYISLGFGFQLK